MWKNALNFQNVIAYMFSIFIKIISECYNLLIDLVPYIIMDTERKKKWFKCYLVISNFLKKSVWLLSFWIEYGNNYQLVFFPESKFNVYLCNLRWCHNRLQTLRRCYRGIFDFLTLKAWKIDLLGTYYIHADFQTCSICKTAELEIPIIISFALVLQTTF